MNKKRKPPFQEADIVRGSVIGKPFNYDDIEEVPGTRVYMGENSVSLVRLKKDK
jgi:hypothetical protein